MKNMLWRSAKYWMENLLDRHRALKFLKGFFVFSRRYQPAPQFGSGDFQDPADALRWREMASLNHEIHRVGHRAHALAMEKLRVRGTLLVAEFQVERIDGTDQIFISLIRPVE